MILQFYGSMIFEVSSTPKLETTAEFWAWRWVKYVFVGTKGNDNGFRAAQNWTGHKKLPSMWFMAAGLAFETQRQGRTVDFFPKCPATCLERICTAEKIKRPNGIEPWVDMIRKSLLCPWPTVRALFVLQRASTRGSTQTSLTHL